MDYKALDPRDLKLNKNELAARLAVPTVESFDFSELYERLISVARPAYVAERVDLIRENGEICLGKVKTSSAALKKISMNASGYIVFAATLGIGVDRLILKTSKISPHEAFVIDAMADALIESLCDFVENELCCGISASGRFSPGYADLELSVGYEILSLCKAEKTLGIKVSKSGLMIPRKSVNAIIAVKKV